MEMLLWASILVAVFSLLGILVLVLAACFCMTDRHSSGTVPLSGKLARRDNPELVIQITHTEEHPIHGMILPAGNTLGELPQSQKPMQQQQQQTSMASTSVPDHNSVGAIVTTNAPPLGSTRDELGGPTSAPASVISPQCVPMHAVSQSMPVSAPTSTASPRSVPSDWFNNSDEPSLSDFMITRDSVGTK